MINTNYNPNLFSLKSIIKKNIKKYINIFFFIMTKINVSLYFFGRFITITYFLTDVDDGGEVVVPLANNKFEVFSS